jgi:hypothetical protein
MKSVLFLVVLSLSSHPAMGAQGPETFRLGQESKFETLKNLYEQAPHPAQLSDFEAFSGEARKRRQECVMVLDRDPNKLLFIVAGILTRVTAATRPYGPAFPGEPERVEHKLVAGPDYFWMPEYFKYFINKWTSRDLLVSVVEHPNGWIYPGIGNRVRFSFRKIDNVMPFKMEHNYGVNTWVSPVLFGYCYNK